MPRKPSRRAFFQQSALFGAGFWVAGRPAVAAAAKSPNEKLGIAVIGVAGRGAGNVNDVAQESIVAMCDVDENRAADARKRFPKAKFYTDFRKMFDQKDIDAVVVATPDHTHAVATLMALRAGKHVYCEKPLTNTVEEARLVAATAARTKRVTQLGTQIHAVPNYRRVVELIQGGAIGAVREVHVWVGKVWSGGELPTGTPEVPAGLDYDLWLGPAKYRPYHPAYLPAKWRGWWDFGGGTLSDMACHYMDLPHWALHLRHVRSVEAEGPSLHPESAPPWLIVRYEYPERHGLPPVKLTWYHGGKRPACLSDGSMPKWGDGVLFVGEKGKLLAAYGKHVLLPKKDFRDYVRPLPWIPNSIGHHREWIEACKTGGGTTCNFAYGGALTETVLLGNVAFRTGKRLEWDAEQGEATNAPEAAQYVTREYRKGWELS